MTPTDRDVDVAIMFCKFMFTDAKPITYFFTVSAQGARVDPDLISPPGCQSVPN